MQKIFFNHIPKTAGTTFYEYLSRFYDEKEIYPKSPLGGYESIVKFDENISDEINFIASHKNIRDYLDRSWNVITFVRDPRDRLISLYNHWRSWTDEEIEKSPVPEDVKKIKRFAKEKGLVDFLKSDHPLIKFHFINGLTKSLIPINKHKILNNNKKLLKEAKKQLDSMCFVGVTERFKESQLLFEYIFNLPHEKSLQDLNKREYQFNFSEDEEKEIEEYLKLDNEIYEYALNKFSESLKNMIIKEVNLRAKHDPELNLFFMHIMKTGGTSLIDILKKSFRQEDIMPERYQLVINSRVSKINEDHKKLLEYLRNHPVYAEKIKNIESRLPDKSELRDLDYNIVFNEFKLIADHTTLQTVLPKNWKIFTILRDPEKRLHSHLNDLKSVLDEDIEKIPDTLSKKRELMFDIKKLPADEVFNIENDWIKQTFYNNQTRFVAGFFGKPPDFYEKPENDLFATAMNNLDNFLTVGITERMFESVALIHYKTGLAFDGRMPFANSRGSYKKEKISEDNLEKVMGLDRKLYLKGTEIFEKHYFEMLEDFVSSNFESKKIEKKEILLMSENFIGTGWHQREGLDIGRVYRWTGPSTESVINLPFFNYQLKGAEIYVISAMHSDLVRETNIYLDGQKVDTDVYDLGEGHFLIKFINFENTDKNLSELKIETPYVISHADLGTDANDTRKKGLAVEKIIFDLGEFTFHKKPVLLCHSLNTECGIATYTEMLSNSNNVIAIKSLDDLSIEVPSHIHLQHEFGIVSSKQMEEIVDFCNENGIKLFVTMHTVLPSEMNFYSLLLTQISFVFKNDSVLEIFKKIKNNIWELFNKVFSKKDDKWRPGTIAESWEFFKNQNLIIKNAHKIFVHSESAKKELEKQGAKNVELFIHPTILFETSDKLLSLDDGKFHIGFFGFFNRDKKILDLVKTVKEMNNVVLHLYSCVKKEHDAEYYEKVLRETENSNVIWHQDFIPLEEVILGLSKCDLLIWNSRPIAHYSSSGSVRQYLAAKRPILARKNNLIEDLEGIIDIVEDINMETISAHMNNSFNIKKIEEYLENHTWDKTKINYD